MKQILYVLIGPKGAGRSHIGTLVNNHTDIRFLHVEPIWLSLEPGADGWLEVAMTIDALLQKHDKVMIESLGAGEGFRAFFATLAKKYSGLAPLSWTGCFSRAGERPVMVDDPIMRVDRAHSSRTAIHWRPQDRRSWSGPMHSIPPHVAFLGDERRSANVRGISNAQMNALLSYSIGD